MIAPQPSLERAVRLAALLCTVAAAFDIPVAELRGPGRTAAVSRARFAFAWLATIGAHAPHRAVGDAVRRSRVTVIHAIRRATALRDSDPDFRASTDRLLSDLVDG